jgi:predicted transcriptional regulator YheO
MPRQRSGSYLGDHTVVTRSGWFLGTSLDSESDKQFEVRRRKRKHEQEQQAELRRQLERGRIVEKGGLQRQTTETKKAAGVVRKAAAGRTAKLKRVPDVAVTQIAQRLGVSPATLYRYLPAARTANTPGV